MAKERIVSAVLRRITAGALICDVTLGMAGCGDDSVPRADALTGMSGAATQTLGSTAARVSGPQVAVDGTGRATVVWSAPDASVRSATASAGARFSAPTRISTAGHVEGGAEVRANAAGEVIAGWMNSEAGSYLKTAGKDASGPFLAPSALSARVSGSLEMAIDDAGNVVADWLYSDLRGVDAPGRVQVAERPAHGSFSTPQTLSASGREAGSNDIAIGPAGRAIAVWSIDGPRHSSVIQAAVRAVGHTFSPPFNVSTVGGQAFAPEVGIDGAGRAIVVWQQQVGRRVALQAAVCPPGGVFSRPRALAYVGAKPGVTQLAVARGGQSTVVWRKSSGRRSSVQALRVDRRGVAASPVTLSHAMTASDPRIAVNGTADTIVVWQGRRGGHAVIQAATAKANRSFSPPRQISASGSDAHDASPAIDAAGRAVVVWRRALGDRFLVQARRLDATR